MKNKILASEDESVHKWLYYIHHPEEVLWQGGPQKRDFRPNAKKGFIYLVLGGLEDLFIFLLTFFILAIILSMVKMEGILMIKLAIFVIGLILPFLVNYLNDNYRQRTQYMITRDGLFFRLGKSRRKIHYHFIPFENIVKASYEEYHDKSGVLHFFVKEQVDFKTEEFHSGRLRYHPTFESIGNVIEVWNLFNETKARYIQPDPVEWSVPNSEINVTEKKSLVKTAFLVVQSVLVIIMSLYVFDFYFLSPQTTVDQLAEIKTNQQWYRNHTTPTGGGYLTKKGLRFSISDFTFHKKENLDMEITYSPVFRSVKDVRIDGVSFKKRLTSDLNGFLSGFHFVTLFVLLGSRILVDRKETLTNDFLLRVAISNVVFLMMSGIIWFLLG
ncbi:MAG: hypothetical protein DWQ02_03735 [Bacteroidetes bacterium]|nr:MAG: hypothetical protein DWQ02_03735 [Bacteroidota bacterium]